MLENYINQIITMGALADSVTIIDDRQIIRYFQPFNPNIVPFKLPMSSEPISALPS